MGAGLQPVVSHYASSMAAVLEVLRRGAAVTRPEICRHTGLARNLVADRVDQLIRTGLIAEGELGQSTGGRAPRSLRFRAEAGRILVAELGATLANLGVADLSGNIVASIERPLDVARGPEATLSYIDELLRSLAGEHCATDIWGIAIGLPGPVEWETGRPVAPPIMPGWDGFDVRGFFSERFGHPVWVDNDVNAMATGEVSAGVARGHDNVIYVKVGTGIGAGLVSRGKLHRGAQGAAGDIGHMSIAGAGLGVVCRCGNTGCLEALAGGAALVRGALAESHDDRTSTLAKLQGEGNQLTLAGIINGALHGDPTAISLLTSSAELVGEALAGMVNFFNPSMIVMGGSLGRSLDLYLATVRRVVLNRSLPLATRNLQIVTSPLGNQAGLIGGAFTVIDELLAPGILADWIDLGSPSGLPRLSGQNTTQPTVP